MKGSVLIITCLCFTNEVNADNFDILIDTKENSIHRLDSLNILIYCKYLFERKKKLRLVLLKI
jgi:hypothetical protein